MIDGIFPKFPDVNTVFLASNMTKQYFDKKIITGWNNSRPVKSLKFISPSSSDPLVPCGHKKNGKIEWADTDHDGLPDGYEARYDLNICLCHLFSLCTEWHK